VYLNLHSLIKHFFQRTVNLTICYTLLYHAHYITTTYNTLIVTFWFHCVSTETVPFWIFNDPVRYIWLSWFPFWLASGTHWMKLSRPHDGHELMSKDNPPSITLSHITCVPSIYVLPLFPALCSNPIHTQCSQTTGCNGKELHIQLSRLWGIQHYREISSLCWNSYCITETISELIFYLLQSCCI
jgi:hypothetical protein